MGSRGPYVDELEPPPAAPVDVRWLDTEAVIAEFHHGDSELDVFRRGLLDFATGCGGWRAPGGSHRLGRRALLHDERWGRGDCGG